MNSGKLNSAKELFLYTLQKKYLPATSAFYLGEIEYKRNNYKNALAFYKKSITIYPKKTSFSEKLLYHTGVSFLKLKQKQKAKLTFQKLINEYPNSKYAKLAKKELENYKNMIYCVKFLKDKYGKSIWNRIHCKNVKAK